MSESTLSISRDELRRAVGRLLGYSRTPANWSATTVTDVEDIIKAGLRKAYNPPLLPGERYPHRWSFLFPTALINTVAPYSTGTIAVVNGVVTLTDGTFPTWAADGHLRYANSEYEVATKDSPTQLTLTDLTVNIAAGSGYTLGQWVFALPDDFVGIQNPLLFEPRNVWPRESIQVTGESQMHKAREPGPVPSKPFLAAVRPKTFSGATGQRWELLLFPTPDGAYPIRYWYEAAPDVIDGTNIYVRGGEPFAELVRRAVLYCAEQELQDNPGLHKQEFFEALAAAIGHDRDAHAPDSLGFTEGDDWIVRPGDRHWWNHLNPTYNGIAQ